MEDVKATATGSFNFGKPLRSCLKMVMFGTYRYRHCPTEDDEATAQKIGGKWFPNTRFVDKFLTHGTRDRFVTSNLQDDQRDQPCLEDCN